MQIVINGQAHDAPQGQTLRALIESLALDAALVAVELDGAIVRQPHWAACVLRPGARLEIVHFVGGG
jgi:sulfur carrier protein